MLNETRARGGFSLVEILVALTIVMLLAAALYPVTAGRLRQGQATALATQFDALRQAVTAYHEDVRRYPLAISQLTTPLGPGAQDACGGNVPPILRARWRGPYVNADLTGGRRVGDATILDTMFRSPPTVGATQAGELGLVAIEVDSAVVALLERQYDAAFDFTNGTIRWLATSPPQGTLTYRIAIRGC